MLNIPTGAITRLHLSPNCPVPNGEFVSLGQCNWNRTITVMRLTLDPYCCTIHAISEEHVLAIAEAAWRPAYVRDEACRYLRWIFAQTAFGKNRTYLDSTYARVLANVKEMLRAIGDDVRVLEAISIPKQLLLPAPTPKPVPVSRVTIEVPNGHGGMDVIKCDCTNIDFSAAPSSPPPFPWEPLFSSTW